jgi:Arc/MetJ family transcription regulator
VKTTIDISDPLLQEARAVAARDGTTIKALVERGLRSVLREHGRQRKTPFRLRKASFKGDGLRPEAASVGWGRLHELAYEDRGG